MDVSNKKIYIIIYSIVITCFGLAYIWLLFFTDFQLTNPFIIFQLILNLIMLVMLSITAYLAVKNNKAFLSEKNKLTQFNLKLAEKEEVFRTLFEQSPFGITFGNIYEDIIDVNNMFEKIVGRTREELLKLKWSDITHPEDIEKDRELFHKLMENQSNGYSIRKRYIRPDNSIVWVNLTVAPLKIESRPDLCNICIIEDITSKIEAENSLNESERSMTMLLSNLPGMAYQCSFDRNWTMKYVSEGCFDLTGYNADSLLFNKDISFNEIILPEYREMLWNKWNNALSKRDIFQEEYEICTANGKKKWVYEQGRGIYDNNGNVIELEGLIIDISLQKNREEEILYLTYHDVMTGLYNRRYYEDIKYSFDEEKYYPLSVIIGDINGLKLINSALGHGVGDKLILRVADILRSCIRKTDVLSRIGGDEFSILMPNTTYERANEILTDISNKCEAFSAEKAEYHLSFSLGLATKKDKTQSMNEIIKMAEDSMFRQKLLQNKSLHSAIISSMKNSLYEKSQETEEHALRLIEISKAFGKKLNLVKEQLTDLELLSTLHDIGKIGITDNILNKPGKLTDEEWKEMKKHPEVGYRIAMSTPELKQIADYILNHHEWWDGNGYPYGRKGEEIPLLSRIILIADAYDAMTSDRPYRKAMTKVEALEEIRKNAGTQFDPVLAELFLNEIANDL